MDEKDCTTCKNAYIKDGVYLICDIDGIQNDVVKNCKNYDCLDNFMQKIEDKCNEVNQ